MTSSTLLSYYDMMNLPEKAATSLCRCFQTEYHLEPLESGRLSKVTG